MAHCGVICMQICGFSLSGLLAVTAFLFTTAAVHAQEIITVFGSRAVFQHAGVPTDTPNLIRLAPGGAVSRNGALTSIPQYRGLHTYRVQTHLDGRQPHTAGPAWMDSPLHYMPSSLMDSVQVHRGIAPVGSGSAIGGYIDALSYTSRYSLSEDYEFHGRVTADNLSFNDGNSASVFLAVSNDRARYHLYGAHDQGDETNSADIKIRTSHYKRDFFGFGTGQQFDRGELMFDYARNNTGNAGVPALPMDIHFYHTDLMNLRYHGDVGEWHMEAQVHYQETDHDMSNYALRDPPDFSQANILPPFRGTDKRLVLVDGLSIGGKLIGSHPWGEGTLRMGLDFRQSESGATVYDPDAPPFFVENFDDTTTDEYGAFIEWSGDLTGPWSGEFGVRVHHTRTDADSVQHFRPTCEMLLRVNASGEHPKYGSNGSLAMRGCDDPTLTPADWMPPPAMSVGMLSGRFNRADRSQDDTEIDATAVLRYDWGESTELEFGLAHKTRAPAYMERYLWVPLEINAGLGDGNNYVGDINLKPEDSWQIELGLNWEDSGRKFSPRVFARRVDDYITGIPATDEHLIRVSSVLNGDPTPIQFANVDAEFYGADAVFGFPLTDDWRFDGTVSYVRGKLRESFESQERVIELEDGATSKTIRTIRDDNVYRMPPLRGLMSVSRTLDDWIVSVEVDWAARQSKISQLLLDDPQSGNNHNRSTSGYALYNLRTEYTHPSMGFMLSAGVENLTDRMYVDHMNGFNRVSGGDLAVGERLPGPGRNIYARVNWEW